MTAPNRRRVLVHVVLDHVRKVAGATPFLVQLDYRLGRSDVSVDLAIAADDFIAILVHLSGEPLHSLSKRLMLCRRHFDRVVVVTPRENVRALQAVDVCGAALWSCSDDGGVVEHAPSERNRVSPIAFLDLLDPNDRADILRRLVPVVSQRGPQQQVASVR